MAEEPKASGDWKREVFDWLKQQGVSTVLLIVLSCAVAYGFNRMATEVVPDQIKAINAGYERTAVQHESTVKIITESQERQNAANLKAYRDEADSQRRHDEEKTRLIRELSVERRVGKLPE